MENKKFKFSRKQIIIGVAIAFVLLFIVSVVGMYNYFKHNNVPIQEEYYLYVSSGAEYQDVFDSLNVHGCIVDSAFFNWSANKKNYPQNIKSGRYKVEPNMSINALLNKLISGNQDPLKVVIGKFRSKEVLAQRLARKLEFDSADFMSAIENELLLDSFGFTLETSMAMFIPNTYEVYWNVTPEDFLKRMNRERQKFWNTKRQRKAADLGMTYTEVVVLASIVDEETNKDDEKLLVASVYLNRLRKGHLLQADPTVRFAINDFTIRRVLRKHLKFDSPYNTYIYKGLPPGPICIPSISSIDAVLENKQTDYMYFCAKEDFSGYHNFAVTHKEHIQNARKFQKALNERKIFK